MSVNINSITDSHDAWVDFKYGGNTRGISDIEIRDIEARWGANLSRWKVQAEKDENKYEITDENFNDAKTIGAEKAKERIKEKTGVDCEAQNGSSNGALAGSIIGSAAGLAGGAAAMISMSAAASAAKAVTAAQSAAQSAASSLGPNGSTESMSNFLDAQSNLEGATAKAKKADKASIAGAAMLAASGGLMLGIATATRAADPNGDAAKALQEFTNTILPEAQAQMSDAETRMEEASEFTIETTEELNETNEENNEKIEEANEEFITIKERVQELTDKADSGEALTEDEKEYIKESTPALEELGEYITDISEENMEETEDKHDEILEYQENYDAAADTVSEVEGVTELAASFDEQTVENTEKVKTSATIGEVGSYLVTGSGTMVIANGVSKCSNPLTLSTGITMIALGGVAVGTAMGAKAQYGHIKEKQEEYKTIAETEIQARTATQELNAATAESYDTQITEYDDNISIVEDLETEIPEDLEVPDEKETERLLVSQETLVNGGENPNANASTFGILTSGNKNDENDSQGNTENDKNKNKKQVT